MQPIYPFSIALTSWLVVFFAFFTPSIQAMSAFRHPVVAVSHGPGPMWLLKQGNIGKDGPGASNVRTVWKRIYSRGAALPKRILFVSAHWESGDRSGFEISASSEPDMVYDYYGFPQEAYDVKYKAKGDPAFAQELKEQLAQYKIKARLVERGFDHGVFVPMSLIRPQADIPIVTLSINDQLDAKAHFKLGQAISSFRDHETLIICSGQATHNMRSGFDFNKDVEPWADTFQNWIDDTFSDRTSLSYAERQKEIENWRNAPSARTAHPSPDHFTTFIVAAGAGMAKDAPGAKKLFGGWGAQFSFATYAYGEGKSETKDEL